MITTVARKEFTETWRDGRFRWLALACVLLVTVSALSGFQVTLSQLRDQAVASEAERDNFTGQGAKNPHAAAHFGQYAFRPVLLPAAIDPGVAAYMGSMVWLEAHRMNLPEFRPAEDAADFGRAAPLSVAWVLQHVVPLFIIVITFGAVAGERERGTLALALSQGAGLRALLAGKALASAGALLAVLLPLVLLAIALFTLLAPAAGAAGSAARLGWMGLGYLLYIAGFTGLALLVSTLERSRRNAFFVLVTAWILVCVALPRAAGDLAASLHPTPTPAEFWAAIRRGEGSPSAVSQIPEERVERLRAQVTAELLAQHGVERPDQLPVNLTAVVLQRLEEADAPVFDHNFGRIWDSYEAQRRFQQRLAWLSPAIAVRALSMAMAGADPYAQRHFSTAAEAHRRRFIGQLNELQAVEGAGRPFYVAPADRWQAIDAFAYRPPVTATLLARHAGDLAVLAAWAVLPLGLALLAAGRRPLVR